MIWNQPDKAFCTEGAELAKGLRWESGWPVCVTVGGDGILAWMRSGCVLWLQRSGRVFLSTDFHSDCIGVLYMVN